jgi:hypothetical protein
LYGEVDSAMRASVEAHLETCARCAAEVSGLGDVRAELAMWAPPDAELGFAIVRKSDQPPAQVLRPAPRGEWWRSVPAWAQAAAAVLVLAAGLSLANLQVRSGPDGFSVTTGWIAAPALSEPFDGAAIERRVEGRVEGRVEQALASLEQELRSEIQSARNQQAVTARASAPADEATIRRVRELLAASEERQARELALRLTQFTYDMNLQRRADLQMIQKGFGQYDEQMLRQRQMMNNVIRASIGGQQ